MTAGKRTKSTSKKAPAAKSGTVKRRAAAPKTSGRSGQRTSRTGGTMKDPTDLGTNRTGIATAPLLAKAMRESALNLTPPPQPAGWHPDPIRQLYLEEAEPVGSMPPPASLKGVAKTAKSALQGDKANVLIDKLAERLAFERGGTRLYQSFLRKLEVRGAPEDGPTLAEVTEIAQEELRHFALLKEALEELGADPTVMTPCADGTSVVANGLLQVVADPRTDVLQSLGILLQAELTDNAGWALLIDLAEAMGHEDMAEEFRTALENEDRHLATVRSWVASLTLAQATGAVAVAKAGK